MRAEDTMRERPRHQMTVIFDASPGVRNTNAQAALQMAREAIPAGATVVPLEMPPNIKGYRLDDARVLWAYVLNPKPGESEWEGRVDIGYELSAGDGDER